MEYIVYVLQSISTNRRYIGHTIDLARRLREHNAGHTPSTKKNKPYTLVYKEKYNKLIEAVKREKYFKTHKGYNELNSIMGH